MTEQFRAKSEESDFPIIPIANAIHHINGNTFVEGAVLHDASADDDGVREAIASAYGGDADQVILGMDEIRNNKAARVMVGFRKWRSNWDPHAQKGDPNQN